MPARLGPDIVALQAEDHYVRVHTALGSELLLMRLSDAIAELDGRPGLRVHRSWWVARTAVVGCEARGRKLGLRLTNGLLAPVARNAVVDAKALAPSGGLAAASGRPRA
jgi:DNA-binding LytR/AlgR family response regulator